MDQRQGTYTTNAKSSKWSHTGLSYILDTLRVNCQTVEALNNGVDPRKSDSYKSGIHMATDLVTPHIKRRSKKSNLPKTVTHKMSIFLGEEVTSAVRKTVTEPGIHFEGRILLLLVIFSSNISNL